MRKKVKKSLTILTALALLVSMFCDSGLFVNAEEPAVEAEVMNDGGEETAVIVEYVPVEQPEGISVKAYAEQGVLPEGTTMSVTALDENGDSAPAYQEAVQALEDNGVEYDGMLAYDISFYDASGNEIEPEDGKVQVKMELNSDLLPEEADAQSIEVQHHVETADGIQVESVADAADVTEGTVAADENTVTAEFAVDSFSSFTITWTGWLSNSVAIIKYVDSDGNEIEGTHSENVSVNTGKSITLSDYAGNIDGFTYLGAYLNDVSGTSIARLRRNYGGSLQYSTNTTGNDWSKISSESVTVVLVYEKNTEVTPPTVTEDKKLTHEKYVTQNEDGTYDLNLTVSGAVGSIKNKALVDVLLIVDKSGSMNKAMDSNADASSPNRRIDKVANAVSSLTNTLSGNPNLNVRYSLVTFSGPTDWVTNGQSSDAVLSLDWSSSAAVVSSAVASINPNGGTNYEAGINRGIEQLKTARSGSRKIVIFLTDGVPTVRNSATSCYESDENSVKENNNAAEKAIAEMTADEFYCIGAGPSFTSDDTSLAVTNLNNLKDAALQVGEKKVYSATNTTKLDEAFKEIGANISTILCDHVTITDTLSENVQIVMNGDKPKKLQVKIQDAEGNTIYGPAETLTLQATEKNAEATLTAEYKDGQIILAFPTDYKLEAGWTYVVTAQIEATEKAYENYRNAGNAYPDTGDANTGETSSNKKGMYSNTEANVEYVYNNEEIKEAYSRPVIQLNPGTLLIEKTVSGLENKSDILQSLVNSLKFEICLNGTNTELALNAFEYDSDSGKYSYSIEGISPNTTYSVTENNESAKVDGYDLNASSSGISGVIEKNSIKTATFTNEYTPSNRILTVKKTVAGNMGDTNNEFTFALELKKDNSLYAENISYEKNNETVQTLAAENGKYIFVLKHNDTVELTVPYGCVYTITEPNLEADYEVAIKINGESVDDATGTLENDTTVEFTNTKNITTPTGLVRTIAPFAIMLVAGVAIVVGLFFGNRRRSRR